MADLSVREAAAELGVGSSWLYAKARTAEVPCQRYGRTLRFTSEQVEQIRALFAQPVVSSRRLRSMGHAS